MGSFKLVAAVESRRSRARDILRPPTVLFARHRPALASPPFGRRVSAALRPTRVARAHGVQVILTDDNSSIRYRGAIVNHYRY